MKQPLIRCPNCKGTGKSHLDPCLAYTLADVRRSKKPVTTADLGSEVPATTLANRLVILERHGLVERVGKAGKNILWKAIK